MRIIALCFLLALFVAVVSAGSRSKASMAKILAAILNDSLSDSYDAYSDVYTAGIGIRSSGGCYDRMKRGCTSLDGARPNTISGILSLKKGSGCPVTITGGTEIGHATGMYSHGNGYKLDIAFNSCIDPYITKGFSYMGYRSDGAIQYKSAAGNVYAKEGNHWDITFY
jgi:hypothetical protein